MNENRSQQNLNDEIVKCSFITLDLFKSGTQKYPEFDYEQIRRDHFDEDRRSHIKEMLSMDTKKMINVKNIVVGSSGNQLDKSSYDKLVEDTGSSRHLIPASTAAEKGGFYVNRRVGLKWKDEELADSVKTDTEIPVTPRPCSVKKHKVTVVEPVNRSVATAAKVNPDIYLTMRSPEDIPKKCQLTSAVNLDKLAVRPVSVAKVQYPYRHGQPIISKAVSFAKIIGQLPAKRLMPSNVGRAAGRNVHRLPIVRTNLVSAQSPSTSVTPTESCLPFETATGIECTHEYLPKEVSPDASVAVEPIFTRADVMEASETLLHLQTLGFTTEELTNLAETDSMQKFREEVKNMKMQKSILSVNEVQENVDENACGEIVLDEHEHPSNSENLHPPSGDNATITPNPVSAIKDHNYTAVYPRARASARQKAAAKSTSGPIKRNVILTLGKYMENEKEDRIPSFPLLPMENATIAYNSALYCIKSAVPSAIKYSLERFCAINAECRKSNKPGSSTIIFVFTQELHSALERFMVSLWRKLALYPSACSNSASRYAVDAADVLEREVWPEFQGRVRFGRLCLEICRCCPDSYMILRTPTVKEALAMEGLNPLSTSIIWRVRKAPLAPKTAKKRAVDDDDDDEIHIIFDKPSGKGSHI